MSIETICPGCGRKLRTDEVDAGRQARCPVCNTIYTVGAPDPAGAAQADGEDRAQWRMRAPEGQTYGPVTRRELDRWVAEGRVTADCELHCESTDQWETADALYPVLRPQVPAAAGPQSAGAERTARYRYTAPHRGVLILVLGILSWIVACPIFGIVAWVLGSSDLREMRAGRMDPSGMGLTQAGQIIGMIHAILLIGGMVLLVFLTLAFVAVR